MARKRQVCQECGKVFRLRYNRKWWHQSQVSWPLCRDRKCCRAFVESFLRKHG